MVEKTSKVQPAIVGGLIAGLLTAIPLINLINVCCCLGIVIGGVVAARMLIKRSPVLPITSGDGAITGALAGVVGALIYLVIGVPLAMLTQPYLLGLFVQFAESNPQLRDVFMEAIRQSQSQSTAQKLLAAIMSGVMYGAIIIAFSTIGGIIGVALFEKRKGQQPPTGGPGYPPPGYYPPGFTPPTPPPSGPPPGNAPPPNEPPYGGGQPPPY